MIKFSITSAFRRKTVSFLAILGVGLGSGLLVTLLSLSTGIKGIFSQTFQNLSGTITVSAEGSGILGRLLGNPGDPLPSSYFTRVRNFPGIDLVSPYVTASMRVKEFGALGAFGLGLTGMSEGEELFGSPRANIVEGTDFSVDNEIIVGVRIIDFTNLSGEPINIGDTFTVPVGKGGKTMEVKLAGIFETGQATNDQGIFGSPALARKIGEIGKNEVSGILARVSDPETTKEIAASIEEEFEGSDPAISASIPADLFEGFSSFFNVFNVFLLGIALVAAVAGGIAVMVVMLLSSFERRREFGILKAAGWSNFSLISSVLITSLTLSILGSFLGLLLGTGAGLAILSQVEQQIVAFTPTIFAWAGGVGLLTGVLGGIVPALAAARVSPIETLRGE